MYGTFSLFRMIYDISCNLSGADTGIFKQKWISTMTPGGGGGVCLGWVSDRDAQHRMLTRNATKGQKGGSKLYISPNFVKK